MSFRILAAMFGGFFLPGSCATSIVAGSQIDSRHYADLLSAGLGVPGIANPVAPLYIDPLKPTPSELRRNAIHSNYRGVLDPNPLSGFGRLYGPLRAVPGMEHIFLSKPGSISFMVQVPDSFDPANACIITATSSGSAGIYGAIGTSGEWGLLHNCAVAYTDKGTGTGLVSLDDQSVNRRDGTRSLPEFARDAIFSLPATTPRHPTKLASKHLHSQQNSEAIWPNATLRAIEFAHQLLSQQFGPRYVAAKAIVIASSTSNGAGAALRAVEQDVNGLISGVAVSEPQVQVAGAKSLLDYASFASLYQHCIGGMVGRCLALAEKGLLSGPDFAGDALRRLHNAGWLPDADILQAAHAGTNALVAAAYANAYGRYAVTDDLCGLSFAYTDLFGKPIAMPARSRAASFANQGGVVGNIVYEQSLGGPSAYQSAISPTSVLADGALDAFLCLRRLALYDARVAAGILVVRASANLRGKPTIIVHGRRDAMVPVTHSSRAYLAANLKVEGAASKLRYIEVTNANHFDSFSSALPQLVVPLQPYFLQALDAMYAHLKHGAPLPPSQVVRTLPRLNGLLPLTGANVPPFSWQPRLADRIVGAHVPD